MATPSPASYFGIPPKPLNYYSTPGDATFSSVFAGYDPVAQEQGEQAELLQQLESLMH